MKNDFWRKLNKPILALAPMAGITDSAFRQVCRASGADVVYSEMASASALFFKPQKTLELVRFGKNERPYVVQLFGKTPEHFAKAAETITRLVKPDGLDINFGCPAKKVFGHGSGCALMPQKGLAREIISAVCQNTDRPVSLKIRAGLKKHTAEDFIRDTADLPYSAVMIHARTYEGGFSGPLNFVLCEKIKKLAPEKIVLANGGITDASQAAEILKKHPSLDGLGIARGAWGRPWIFQDIKKILGGEKIGGEKIGEPDFSKIKKVMLNHAKLIFDDKGKTGLFEIRKHMGWYVKGLPGASELRRKLVMAESLDEITRIIDEA